MCSPSEPERLRPIQENPRLSLACLLAPRGSLLAVLPLTLALGCASPGPPQPPSLHLPQLATALRAERIGDEVRLSWTNPATTTDGDAVKLPLTAVLCRAAGSTRAKPSCKPVHQLAVNPGASTLVDVLPAQLLNGTLGLLLYRVELLNPNGRSAGQSDAAYTASGPAPLPVAGLTVAARREGALVTWQPASSPAVMELTRTVAGKPALPPAAPHKAAPLSFPGAGRKQDGASRNQPTDTRVVLRATRQPDLEADPGGMLDRSVRDQQNDGQAFLYVAQRVRTMDLGGHTVELRGPASPPVAFTFRNTFAPGVPTGLVSVPSLDPLSIDLSWEAGTENDLQGYKVYRRDGSGSFRQLTPAPLPSPSFRDLNVEPGVAYTYRVTAVDTHHNESAPSLELREIIRK